MTADTLHIVFNGKSTSVRSILVDITPNLYSTDEAMKIMETVALDSLDEVGCCGHVVNQGRNHNEAMKIKGTVAVDSLDEVDCRGTVFNQDSNHNGPMTFIDGKVCTGADFKLRVDTNKMAQEVERISTFHTWPETNPMVPSQLARAGFYYTGVLDIVKCFSCGGQVQDWEFGDTAMGEHKKHFPHCHFVKQTDTQNVPLLEMKERPEVASRLSSRIEQSQKDIERRAKEKEAMLEKVETGKKSSDYFSNSSSGAGSNSSSGAGSNSSKMDESMTEDDEGLSLFGKYNQEHVRLQSFKDWPRTCPIEPRDLARAGFYYLHHNDDVQCFACFGQISRWKPSDVPTVEHRVHFPNCPFVKGLEVGNDPISTPPVFHTAMHHPMRSASAPMAMPSQDQLRAAGELQRQSSAQLRSSLGPLIKCKHTSYVMEAARLGTFKTWPQTLRISATPRLLARAGFYYTGLADECKCFYCDGGLKNWERDDEPWTEHAKWFPRCEWLIQQRGQAFIAHVQSINPPPGLTAPMQFQSPNIVGKEEPFFQPPHTFTASYVERPSLASSSASSKTSFSRQEPEKKKEMTIEEEKAAALRKYGQKNQAEPEAAAEVYSRPRAPPAAKQTPPKLKLVEDNTSAHSSIDDIMLSPTTQMAIEMGYDHDLVRYVVSKHLDQTGRHFSTPEELLEAVWDAQEKGVDLSTLQYGSSGKAAGGHDNDDDSFSKKLDFSTSSSSAVDIQAQKLAGLSINDDPSTSDRRSHQTAGMSALSGVSGAQTPLPLTSGSHNSDLSDKQLCKICLDNELNTVFMPCKHLATCRDCAAKVKECPMCREPILTSFEIYMP